MRASYQLIVFSLRGVSNQLSSRPRLHVLKILQIDKIAKPHRNLFTPQANLISIRDCFFVSHPRPNALEYL